MNRWYRPLTVFLGTFDLKGFPQIPWTVVADLSLPTPEGPATPWLVVTPHTSIGFSQCHFLKGVEELSGIPQDAGPGNTPKDRKLLAKIEHLPLDPLRPRGDAGPSEWNLEDAHRAMVALLEQIDKELTAAVAMYDKRSLARVFLKAWDCHPWAFFWSPLRTTAQRWLKLADEVDPEDVALLAVERMAQGRVRRPPGRPAGSPIQVGGDVVAYNEVRALPKESRVRNVSGRVAAALFERTTTPALSQVDLARARVRERRRQLREEYVVPMALPFPDEALTVEPFLEPTWETWFRDPASAPLMGASQRTFGCEEHLGISWREALTSWVLKAPTERRLRVICGGRWDKFQPCDLPPAGPPPLEGKLPPPEVTTRRPGEDDPAVALRISKWVSEEHLRGRGRTPTWFTEEKQAQAAEHERILSDLARRKEQKKKD
jgi:hypothetical protein